MHHRFALSFRTYWGLMVALMIGATTPLQAVEATDPSRFEREILVTAAEDPTSLEVAADGRVLFVERTGGFKIWDPQTRLTTKLGVIPTHAAWDTGLLALLLAPDFLQSGHFYVLRCPEEKHLVMRVSRFQWNSGKFDPSTEVKILEWAIDSEEPPHCGGGLAWDRAGNLLIGAGDNTPPQDVPAMVSTPGKETSDARRSAGNSMDLRGKVLRIRVAGDGSYSTPDDNLFPKAGAGRPEVYAMGVRNPFRISTDSKTGVIVVGDIGGNVEPKLGLGPEGYDEINLMTQAGFYGWPFMSGPNEAWQPFDPATKKSIGPAFNPEHVVNDSRANTGLRNLPPAIPALLYYPTVSSPIWPELGSGGRSVTGGPMFRYRSDLSSTLQLPESLDGCILFGEYMRNWLMAIRLTPDGKLAKLEPFMPGTVFRKPIDLKVGPEGALYVVEYGDRFRDNRDGQITRCVYRRGNRVPVAKVEADTTAGPLPLKVHFNAAGSMDPDGDSLKYEWKFSDGSVATGMQVEHVFETKARGFGDLTVSDTGGAMATLRTWVTAGNSRPILRFTKPQDGSFFAGNDVIDWGVEVTDAEDGALPAERVLVQVERRERAGGQEGKRVHPGLGLMRGGTCFACHSATEKSAGPPYLEVSRKYARDAESRERLAAKIISGGMGVWGQVPMPPHPQHTLDQTRQMVDWILSLAIQKTVNLPIGLAGQFKPGNLFDEPGGAREGVLYFTAVATDMGAGELTPLRGETAMVLRSRRQRAAHFDRSQGAMYQENLGDGLVARVSPGGWVGFERIQVGQVRGISLRARGLADTACVVEVRLDEPNGELLGELKLEPQNGQGNMQRVACALKPSQGIHTLCLLLKTEKSTPGASAELSLIEFQ